MYIYIYNQFKERLLSVIDYNQSFCFYISITFSLYLKKLNTDKGKLSTKK